MKSYCIHCGTSYEEGDQYCPECGAELAGQIEAGDGAPQPHEETVPPPHKAEAARPLPATQPAATGGPRSANKYIILIIGAAVALAAIATVVVWLLLGDQLSFGSKNKEEAAVFALDFEAYCHKMEDSFDEQYDGMFDQDQWQKTNISERGFQAQKLSSSTVELRVEMTKGEQQLSAIMLESLDGKTSDAFVALFTASAQAVTDLSDEEAATLYDKVVNGDKTWYYEEAVFHVVGTVAYIDPYVAGPDMLNATDFAAVLEEGEQNKEDVEAKEREIASRSTNGDIYFCNIYSDGGIYVRSGPGTTYSKLAHVKDQDTLLLYLGDLSDQSDGTWYHVELPDGRDGWVRGDLIAIDGVQF